MYWYRTYRFITRLRGGLISLTFHQTVHSRSVDLGKITAIALMGTDVERILTGFRFIHELWAAPLEIMLAVYLLERQVFIACVVPAVMLGGMKEIDGKSRKKHSVRLANNHGLAFIACTLYSSRFSKTFQRQWVEKVEARLKLTSYMLGDMKAVKMLGLTKRMDFMIQKLREVELVTSAAYRKLVVLQVFLCALPCSSVLSIKYYHKV